ncbi:hypothetical protein ABDK56_08115 [Sphingomonas sp. ASV193]|uniref:hypothetical protein n=1 Tax=Sphingomonas sp. ASV193 TaxID=3144405 RepID=UPI0032E8B703
MTHHLLRRALAASIFLPTLLGSTPAAACASCGCTLTADWLSQGLAAQPGTTLGLRYDYIPQTRLQSGTTILDRSQIALPADREIERYTYNHSLTVTLDHQFANDFGIDVQLPILTRPHATYAEDTVALSHSDTRGIGDLRVVGRWQGLSTPGSVTGIEAGLVLPTGGFRQAFDGGPEAGERVDRGLQPGTGTVQAVAGVYRLGAVARSVGYFLQAGGQWALDQRAGYRPGGFVQASAALNWTGWNGVTPQLQLSVRHSWRDSGIDSDRPNSGGTQVNLAPGLSAKLSDRLVGFGNVELPLYNRVNGYQLTPRAKASVGLLMHL